MVGAIIFAVVFVVLLLVVFCFRHKIFMSIQFIKEASKATSANTFVMFFPIFQSVIEVILMAFALYIYLQLGSIGERVYQIRSPSHDSCTCNGQFYSVNSTCIVEEFKKNCAVLCPNLSCKLAHVNTNFLIDFFIGYTLFEYLWVMFFITAFSEMVLAGVFAVWYWTMHKEDVPSGTFWESVNRTMR